MKLILLILISISYSYGEEVKLAWDLPTTNTDGTAITDMAGVKVFWGYSSRNYISVTNLPGAQTSTTIKNLPANTNIYFAGTCYNTIGNESAYSEELIWNSSFGASAPIYLSKLVNGIEEFIRRTDSYKVPDCTNTNYVTLTNMYGTVNSATITQSPTNGTPVGIGNYTISILAVDKFGNVASNSIPLYIKRLNITPPSNWNITP